jgi:tetratricopeptide (TPR) repeat protein
MSETHNQSAQSSNKIDGWHLKPFNLNWKTTSLDWILIVFVTVYTLIGMRSFDLRLAEINEDDISVFYAHAFKDPTLFEGDFISTHPVSLLVYSRVFTSFINLIPTLLWYFLDIDPYLITWLFNLAEIFMLGISMYILALAMGQTRLVALIAVLFTYAAGPWGWNLANNGGSADSIFLPIPSRIVLGPVLLALACLIQGRNQAALWLLATAGLIHPGLALHIIVIVGIYWIWQDIQKPFPIIFRRLIGLAIVGLITLLPALVIQLTLPGEPLPAAELIAGMRHNGHIWPWDHLPRWDFAWSTMLKWLVLGALSWRYQAKFSKETRRLWLSSLVGCSLLGLSQVLGAILENLSLLTILGLRSFTWFSLISIPLVIHYWVVHLRSNSWSGAVLGLLSLTLPLYAQEYALFWPLIAGLLCLDIAQGWLSIWELRVPTWVKYGLRATSLLILFSWGVLFLLLPFNLNKSSFTLTALSHLTWGAWGPPPDQLERITLMVSVAFLSLIIWRGNHLPPRRFVTRNKILWGVFAGLLIVIYGSRFLWVRWQATEDERASTSTDLLEAQLWARTYTPRSSLFVFPRHGHWRTMALRRHLEALTHEDFAYVANLQSMEHRNRLLEFYGISAEEGRDLRGPQVFKIERERFQRFSESDFLRFASEFGATHLTLPKDKYFKDRKFDLLLVYENPSYVIYSLESYPYDSSLIQFHLETALVDTLFKPDFSRTTTERAEFQALAQTEQVVNMTGSVRTEPGPWPNSSALLINETTNLIGPSDGLDLSQGTLSVWLRFGAPPQQDINLVQVNHGDDLAITRQLDGNVLLRYNGVNLGTTSISITDNDWHHYLFTWRDGSQQFYIDGILTLAGTAPASGKTADLFTINGPESEGVSPWYGFLAELATFNRVLTEEEIAALSKADPSARQAAAWYRDAPNAAVAAWLTLGWAYYEHQDYRRALPVFERVLALDPANVKAHAGKELSSLALSGRYTEAFDVLNRIVASSSDLEADQLAQAYIGVARAYCEMGQMEKCAATHEQAINLNPASWETFTAEERKLLSQTLLLEARRDLLWTITDAIIEGRNSYLLTNFDQKIEIPNDMLQVVEGPGGDSTAALAINRTLRWPGPPGGIRMQQGSLSMWARLSGDEDTRAYLARIDSQVNIALRREQDGRFTARYNEANLGTTSVTVTDQDWHHYLLTWQDGVQRFYIDGQLVLAGTAPSAHAEIDKFTVVSQWPGFIAEFSIFNRALTPAESVALYSAAKDISSVIYSGH